LLSPGNTADITMAPAVLALAGPITQLLADRAYDAKSLRDWLAERGAEAVIPSQSTRKHPCRYDPVAYKQRNLVERMFCRLKDFRRIATRYDKLARNFLSGVLIAATLTWWAN
jgi:transposase